MKYYIAFLLLVSVLLTGCMTVVPGTTQADSSPTEAPSATQPTKETVPSGWVTKNGKTYYYRDGGKHHVGWLELDGKRYYFDNMGVMQTGWFTLKDDTYYFQADGSAAVGKITVKGISYYFSSTGKQVILVNPWNMIPSNYGEPIVKDIEEGYSIEKSCKEPLEQMLADCRSAGHEVSIVSAYRLHSTQITLYNRKVNQFLDEGMTPAEAREEAGKIVAMPGTSEHELGLAVDLVDSDYDSLDTAQENTDTQKWLMEHCWDYGFILRYPNNKSDKTGIIYEPWHYRYVGKEIALELKGSGLCLEEYFESLS